MFFFFSFCTLQKGQKAFIAALLQPRHRQDAVVTFQVIQQTRPVVQGTFPSPSPQRRLLAPSFLIMCLNLLEFVLISLPLEVGVVFVCCLPGPAE